jgi:hypothetical protein
MKSRLAILYVTSLLAVSPAAVSADTTFFEAKIRPVLVKHCYECHSVEAGKSKGDLLLDTRAALRTGGGSGPAIVPGDPQRACC